MKRPRAARTTPAADLGLQDVPRGDVRAATAVVATGVGAAPVTPSPPLPVDELDRRVMMERDERHRPQALLLSVNETADLLGIHRATVYDLLASGQLRSTTLGRRRVIPRIAVEAFVASLDERARREAEEQRTLAADGWNHSGAISDAA